MKVLRDCYNADEKGMNYPKKSECEHCYSEFEYDKNDIEYGEYGCAFVSCPCCGEKCFLDEEEPLGLTKDNVKFPKHFYHTWSNKEGIAQIENARIENEIKNAIEYFRFNKDEFAYTTSFGDMALSVFRMNDDKCYYVIVSRDFYETDIPFEKPDYA